MVMVSSPVACLFQSTLSVRRATCGKSIFTPFLYISIHALRKESDYCGQQCKHIEYISIHALRKESD